MDHPEKTEYINWKRTYPVTEILKRKSRKRKDKGC